jgi:hypothetical protein
MCYGDPDHGRDGYYRQWIEQQQQEEDAKRWGELQREQEQQEQE